MSEKITNGITCLIEPSGKLLIPENVSIQFNSFRQNDPDDLEAGGILLGHLYENKPDIVIDEITIPLPRDSRKRKGFYRSIEHHKEAVRRWKQSGGTCLYLGLWHTHPEPTPIPSPTDIEDWNKAINFGEFEGNNLFFIIVGTDNTCCWQGIRQPKYKQIIGMKSKFKQLSFSHE